MNRAQEHNFILGDVTSIGILRDTTGSPWTGQRSDALDDGPIINAWTTDE